MIIILKGGTSAEREVSLWTAKSVANALTLLKEEFAEIDAADADWLDQVVGYNPKVVIIALHGPFGEDGTVQKALEEKGIRYTGSNSATSKVAINKNRTKEIAQSLGINLATSRLFKKGEEVVWNREFPVVVKPNGDGSSFGVTIVKNSEDLQKAAENAFAYGEEILLEDFIPGVELSCGVVQKGTELTALPLVEIRPGEEFFNFEAKYNESKCQEICPAEVDEDSSKLIQDRSAVLFKELSCSQYARTDWILSGKVPYLLEINTLPGMTATSLIIKELAAAGIKYEDFIKGLIEGALS